MQPNRTLWSGPAAIVAALLAALTLAACGSSSPSTKSSGTAAAAATTPGGAPVPGRFKAVRECLQKQGITLPQRAPGGKRPPAGSAGPLGGGFQNGRLPKGVTRAKLQAALKKCGGLGGAGAPGRLRDPAFTKALAKFAECMRTNGVDVPKPNTSGNGPIFSTKGLDTGSAKFRAAQQKCSSLLRAGRPGGQGAPPTGAGPGAPPVGEGG